MTHPSTPILPEADPKSLIGFISALILDEGVRAATRRSFRSVQISLIQFLGNQDIKVGEVSAQLVTDYQGYLATKNICAATQSFYLRTLRIILQRASIECEEWFVPVNTSIFRKASTADQSLVLSKDTLRKIAELDLRESPQLDLARDIFMFSFYMQGMEGTDIAALTADNITPDGFLQFHRRANGTVRRIKIGEKAQAIIQKYLGKDAARLFPIRVTGGLFSGRSLMGRNLKKVGEEAGCPQLTLKMAWESWLDLTAQINFSDSLLD